MLNKQVTSTAPHVHLVHDEGRPPVSGVAVYYYARSGNWSCEKCGTASGTTRPDCEHVKLVKERK